MSIIITVDKSQSDLSAGKNSILKNINGVNGIPVSLAPGFPDLEDQFNQMGITDIRLHDGLGIGDLDNYFSEKRINNINQLIQNVPDYERRTAKKFLADLGNHRVIFPNAAAGMRSNDVDLAFKDANYTMTDAYIRRILNNNPGLNPQNLERQLMFRIGRTLDGGCEVPQNADIYAILVSTLVDRYCLNYDKTGLPRKVKYWEIWNEPDLTFFWNSNNPQVYYDFYGKLARMIKAVDPEAKVGGAGVAFGYNPGGYYIDGLLKYCHETGTPIDFISWHCYGNGTGDPKNIIDVARSIESALNKYGFPDIESICTEWNSSPTGTMNTYTKVQSAKNAAYIASTFCYMQKCKVDKSYYYRGDGLSFGLFNDNPNPVDKRYKSFCTYSSQAFNLFSKMRETPVILKTNGAEDTGISMLACKSWDEKKLKILISNYKVDKDFTDGGVPPSGHDIYKQYYIDSNRSLKQLTDQWSLDEWFGGKNPNLIRPDNFVEQQAQLANPPVNGHLSAHERNYYHSDSGLITVVDNIAANNVNIAVKRIQEGKSLSSFDIKNTNYEINYILKNGQLIISDQNCTESTVTLYEIELN
ncbi:Glycosyl hydrolases family 39 [Izhakiella capsodis]|uniref:Glycosyl hydrolases family 39 n=1 Tax=Izhakiella capsodis TaxID=1367852 RepID=A0A1I4X3R5_9GAMM|nr:glycosyl hydrolase [Izhakiella capsodis]SFN20285.1 Glycosyl hydrolases family 39 [Izhakiella capsodis]